MDADVERELRGLAERIRLIEDRLGVAVEAAAGPHQPPTLDSPRADWQPSLQILGLAVVGVGAAYVLRALVAAGAVPTALGVAVGIAYAFAWLAAAGRREEPLYALTAALVLPPLLWEATLRFRVLPAPAGAGVLLAFTALGLAISWRKNLLIVATIPTIAGLATAAALMAGTRNVVPFVVFFLVLAAAIEVSACLEHWLAERWLAAAAADAAVLLATWLVTNPRGIPEGYAPIPRGWLVGSQIALLGMYLASTIVRTLVRHFRVTPFEMAQCAAAFGIAMWGGLPVAPEMLGAGAACYVVSFVMLERGGGRNFYAYSSFGLLLVLAGTRALLTGTAAMGAWAVLAVACVWSRRTTLQTHGAIYLGLALMIARPVEGAVAAALCFLGGAKGPLRLPLFAAAVWMAAGLAASVAPESLTLAARLVVCGAGLIVAPRIR